MTNSVLHASWLRVARAFLVGTLAFALFGVALAATFSQDELDALLAPVALYPDGLLSQVLIASTYPLEVVEAERFLKQQPDLRGEALDEQLAKKNWDPSVQSLAAYPRVLITMSEKLEWTVRLGNAFLEDQGRVMETVQELRRRADAAGNLKSSAEQTVVHEKETIIIEPAQTRVVYVVEYEPALVYGSWWWYAGAYDYYDRYYGSYSYNVSVSYRSYDISRNHWGWARANWHDRRIGVDGRNNRFWNSTGRAQAAGSAWQHDPSHRGSVEYPTSALSDRFRGADTGGIRAGDGNRSPAPSRADSGAPTNVAGQSSPNGPSPNGPFQLPGAPQSAPLQPPEGVPSLPSTPPAACRISGLAIRRISEVAVRRCLEAVAPPAAYHPEDHRTRRGRAESRPASFADGCISMNDARRLPYLGAVGDATRRTPRNRS